MAPHRRRNVIVSNGEEAGVVMFTHRAGNHVLLKSFYRSRANLEVPKLYFERGGVATETNEQKGQAISRLRSEGYKVVGQGKDTLPHVDDGARIYAIRSQGKVYIGSTEMDVNTRMRNHVVNPRSTVSNLVRNPDATVEILERYDPGQWTKGGLLRREGEIINQTPNAINKRGQGSGVLRTKSIFSFTVKNPGT